MSCEQAVSRNILKNDKRIFNDILTSLKNYRNIVI